MKATIVPAQVTTVEDKIAGSLSLSQLLLLTAPVFLGGVIYAIAPPSFEFAAYKLAITVTIAVLSSLMAIRIKGKILLLWAIVIFRYNLRPRYYIFNKNSTHLRDITVLKPEVASKQSSKPKNKRRVTLPHLPTADLVELEQLIANPRAKLSIKMDKKGAPRVYITEVK